MTDERSTLVGIFIGGASRRMGRPKGLLEAPGGGRTLVERWVGIFDELGLACVLVGSRPEYAHLGVRMIDDEAVDAGPLGGVLALLREAHPGVAIAVACDMPRATPTCVAALLAAPAAAAVAPRRDGLWHPFFARFDAALALPVVEQRLARRSLSLQGLLDALATRELPLADQEFADLIDWDRPEEVTR